MLEKINKEKMLTEDELFNISGGAQRNHNKDMGKSTKICHACQLRVDASYKKCPYCGGKLSEE